MISKDRQQSLFDNTEFDKRQQPLADRMRPRNLKDFVGQEHLCGPNKIFGLLTAKMKLMSMILWGPPGVGKTTLASILARSIDAEFVSFSAVLSGVKDIREVIEKAKSETNFSKTILFVDEIHRFNKAQQDAFLHHVEDGTIILIGATTENPSFEINTPLLSRCKVLTLKELTKDNIITILHRALGDKINGISGENINLDHEALDFIAEISQGDARVALNALESSVLLAMPENNGQKIVTIKIAQEALQQKAIQYDKGGEEHYNVISAFIKSLRGSNPDAALYWMARMLEAGEDPMFIVRRMVIFASEDVGNAAPGALQLAIATKEALHFVGLPEGWIPMAQCATYLASAPKSNASYLAYREALKDVKQYGALKVPLHLRNAPTKLMKDSGYGNGYKYPHDFGGYIEQEYMPEKLKGKSYYRPTDNGYDKEIKLRLDQRKKKK